MNKVSTLALAASASLMVAGWSNATKAADLGGDCCSDLEERVAELEATTVRKGNRKVSLELSGQVNKALVAWNDGKSSDAYVVDNNFSSTRFRLKGTGEMAPGWKAGFYMEFEFRDSSSNLVDQTSQVNRGLENALRIRQENVFIESDKYGRITIGQQNGASKDIELINLGGAILDPENYYANSFKLRDTALGQTNAGQGGLISSSSRLGWGVLADSFDVGRLQALRYDTPSVYGFVLSAAWGENDFWDIALRYQKEWNSIRVAAGIGYGHFGDPNRFNAGANFDGSQVVSGALVNQPGASPVAVDASGKIPTDVTKAYVSSFEYLKGSASIMHVPTGIYVTFSAGQRYLNNPCFTSDAPASTCGGFSNSVGPRVANKDASFWDIQPGITKRWWDVGSTTLFLDYARYQNQGVGALYNTNTISATGATTSEPALTATTSQTSGSRISSSDVERWGGGITQAFDGAALELYANYLHYSADVNVVGQSLAATTATATKTAVGAVATPGGHANIQDWDAVITGARIKF